MIEPNPWDGAAAERLIIDDPDEADKLLRSYKLLAGGLEVESEDLRITRRPYSAHLDPRRYSMGLARITSHMRPGRAGELTVLGARTGHGKTSYAQKIAIENARKHRVLFASIEQTREEIEDRMLGQVMRRTVEEVHDHRTRDTEEYVEAFTELRSLESNLFVWRPSKRKDRSIEAITQRALDVSAAVLIIDHSREIAGWHAGRPAEDIMDFLGAFARDTLVSTFLLSQFGRSRDRVIRRPTTDDFQDTSRVEQKADRCIMIWRPFLGNPKRDNVVEIIVAKNRIGPCFRAHAHWNGPCMNYYDATDEDEALFDCCRKRKVE